MKLNKAQECYEKLNSIFDRGIEDFDTASHICDVIYVLEREIRKFETMRNTIVKTHYNQNSDGTYGIKDMQHLEQANEEFSKLNEVEIKVEKKLIPKFKFISPKELYYLKEFFDFE